MHAANRFPYHTHWLPHSVMERVVIVVVVVAVVIVIAVVVVGDVGSFVLSTVNYLRFSRVQPIHSLQIALRAVIILSILG